MSSADGFPLVMPGQRMAIAGRTGSGKSTLGKWILNRSPGHWFILNPKHTAAYADLPDSETIYGANWKRIEKSIEENKFTIWNPTTAEANPEFMDEVVLFLHDTYTHIGVCADELYTLHKNGQCGDGLNAWLTRGRERKQSFVGMTQRPAYVSKFVFTEADFIVGMALTTKDDRKRMYDHSGQEAFMSDLAPRDWMHFDVAKHTLRKFGPVPAK